MGGERVRDGEEVIGDGTREEGRRAGNEMREGRNHIDGRINTCTVGVRKVECLELKGNGGRDG